MTSPEICHKNGLRGICCQMKPAIINAISWIGEITPKVSVAKTAPRTDNYDEEEDSTRGLKHNENLYGGGSRSGQDYDKDDGNHGGGGYSQGRARQSYGRDSNYISNRYNQGNDDDNTYGESREDHSVGSSQYPDY